MRASRIQRRTKLSWLLAPAHGSVGLQSVALIQSLPSRIYPALVRARYDSRATGLIKLQK
ncbi:uncharacterized protein SCHCODRAFT_01311697 [Schizophyllum commune H4-8]|uniref:uncharacterized protein n=1 Tax=Schizophyllum commune (strain H4-8 / FGSC 9210) TaxID=578458 RepID=UPI002160E2C8|nr:uncharacterized protein SCHCODRAFT_01311697 [Schizophyllum commune H4-8]KAI5891619.1 hypothetical protein SCHCODRAFT_01311697 [Schizophyllum commune H4-8]